MSNRTRILLSEVCAVAEVRADDDQPAPITASMSPLQLPGAARHPRVVRRQRGAEKLPTLFVRGRS
ncbi:hypothetical protein, partial [Mangrovactinospora gilvigrisea]|uniref:hypothetical protein n=1 Tax=Mangrovactinospora gilvigrisea TaxID=1428644 RepID=UPI001C313329